MPQLPIDFVRGSSFDRVHDFTQGIDLASYCIDQRSENHVHVIGHYNNRIDPSYAVVIMQTAFQRKQTSLGRKYPPKVRAKSYAVRFVVTLQ